MLTTSSPYPFPSHRASYGMTRKQVELLNFITKRYLETKGCPPSYDEMKLALGLRSKSGIHRLIQGLAERGKVHYLPNRARAVVPVFDQVTELRLPVELEAVVREYALCHNEGVNAAIIRALREKFFPKTVEA